MQIGFHGGKCCGVKTIFGMNFYPEDILPALRATHPQTEDYTKHHKDKRGFTVSSDDDLYFGPSEKETYKARLIRYIDFLRNQRPSGLIEIQLMEYDGKTRGQESWFPVMKELGFTMVARFKNSNSGNYVSTWLKVIYRGDDAELIDMTNYKDGEDSPKSTDESLERSSGSSGCPCGDPLCDIYDEDDEAFVPDEDDEEDPVDFT